MLNEKNKNQNISLNEIFVIGDCHGEYDKLLRLLGTIPYTHNNQIYFVGDLIDRGKDSAKIIKFIREKGFNVVKGNHETFAIEYNGSIFNGSMYGEIYNSWGQVRNGGLATFESYLREYGKEANERIMDDISYFKKLPEYLIVEVIGFNKKILITHGSFLNYIDKFLEIENKLLNTNEEDLDILLDANDLSEYLSKKNLMLCNRKFPTLKNNKYFNVFGHTIVEESIYDYDKCHKKGIYLDEEIGFAAIDTGAFMSVDSKLSAISFPSLNVYNS